MTAIELMDLTFNKKLSELDQYKVVSDLTTQFDPQLLTLLLKSVDVYIEQKRKYLIGYRIWSKKFDKYQITKFEREWIPPLGTQQAIDNIVLTPEELEEVVRDTSLRLTSELQPLQDLRVLIHKLIKDNNESVDSQSAENTSKTVEVFLKPLSGYLKGRKIMKDEDYQNLLKSTSYLIEYNDLPPAPTITGRTQLSVEFIRYLYYLLYINFNLGHNNVLRKKWQLFLHSTFIQFATHGPDTTLKNFSAKPKNYEDVSRSIEYK